jgi:hypothetical protein
MQLGPPQRFWSGSVYSIGGFCLPAHPSITVSGANNNARVAKKALIAPL